MKLTKVPLDQASHGDMLVFAEAHGLDIPAAARKNSPKGEMDLRTLLKTAGHDSGILIIDKPMGMEADSGVTEESHEFDPSRERWAHFMLNPQVTGTEHERQPPAFVSVNADTIHIPWSVQVVTREIFYVHLRWTKERQWKQKTDDSGKMLKGRVSFMVDRYPMSFYGFRGYVDDGVPAIVEKRSEIVFIPPGGTEAGAWAMARQAGQQRSLAA